MSSTEKAHSHAVGCATCNKSKLGKTYFSECKFHFYFNISFYLLKSCDIQSSHEQRFVMLMRKLGGLSQKSASKSKCE